MAHSSISEKINSSDKMKSGPSPPLQHQTHSHHLKLSAQDKPQGVKDMHENRLLHSAKKVQPGAGGATSAAQTSSAANASPFRKNPGAASEADHSAGEERGTPVSTSARGSRPPELMDVLNSLAELSGGVKPDASFLPTSLGNPRSPLPQGQGINEFAGCLQLILNVVDDLIFESDQLSSSSFASGSGGTSPSLASPQKWQDITSQMVSSARGIWTWAFGGRQCHLARVTDLLHLLAPFILFIAAAP